MEVQKLPRRLILVPGSSPAWDLAPSFLALVFPVHWRIDRGPAVAQPGSGSLVHSRCSPIRVKPRAAAKSKTTSPNWTHTNSVDAPFVISMADASFGKLLPRDRGARASLLAILMISSLSDGGSTRST